MFFFDVKNMREIKFNQFAQTIITRNSNDFVCIVDDENCFDKNVDYISIQNNIRIF